MRSRIGRSLNRKRGTSNFGTLGPTINEVVIACIYNGQLPLLRTTPVFPQKTLLKNEHHGGLVWCFRASCLGMALGYFGDVFPTSSEARSAVVAVSRSIRIRYDFQGNKGILALALVDRRLENCTDNINSWRRVSAPWEVRRTKGGCLDNTFTLPSSQKTSKLF
jgi:hypothetical protein